MSYLVKYGITDYLEDPEALTQGKVVARSRSINIVSAHPAEYRYGASLRVTLAEKFAASGALKVFGDSFAVWSTSYPYDEAMDMLERARVISKREADAVSEAVEELKRVKEGLTLEPNDPRSRSYKGPPGKRNPQNR